jgi:hypothetical protein
MNRAAARQAELTPGAASHAALRRFVAREQAFVATATGSGVGRLVVLAAVERRVRCEDAVAAEVDAAPPGGGDRTLRALVRRECSRRRLALQRYRRLEEFHWSQYHLSIDRFGAGRPDAVRDGAAARYTTLYPRMVTAVALALLDGTLRDDELRRALAEQRWPAGLSFPPVLEARRDVLDEVRSPRALDVSADEQYALLDEEEGRPNMRIVSKLATRRDAPAVLTARQELAQSLGVVVAEYDSLKADVAAQSRTRARRMLALLLAGHDSAAVRARLAAEGYEPVKENAIDVTWKRALAKYEVLPRALSRKCSDFDDTVWLLERLSAAGSGRSVDPEADDDAGG